MQVLDEQSEAYFNFINSLNSESIAEIAVKENDIIANYLGWIWQIRHNRKLRNVVDSLQNLRNVIRTQETPIVLQFLCDGCDVCDSKNKNKVHENKPITSDILETKTNIIVESPSQRSHRSQSGEYIKDPKYSSYYSPVFGSMIYLGKLVQK